MNTSSVVYDFKGVAFKSTSEMCKYYNISWTTYMSRRHNGWSVQKALLTPVKRARGSGKLPCKDHMGYEYSSCAEMAKAWDMDEKLLRRRLSDGWSVREALTLEAHEPRYAT